MIPPPVSRRRADELDALLRGAAVSPRAVERHARLLRVVDLLGEVPEPTPRREFVDDLRARLLAEAGTVLVPLAASTSTSPQESPESGRGRRDRRVAAALGTAALLAASGSVGVASQAALPGELLYPVKSVLESARERLATGDRDTGTLLLSRAGSRLDELEELVARDDADSRRATAPTLEAFADQAGEAGDLMLADFDSSGRRSSVLALRDFAASAMPRLEALAPSLPLEARDELEAAAATLVGLDDRAVAACPDCGGAVLVVPRFLSAGPDPAHAPGAEGTDASGSPEEALAVGPEDGTAGPRIRDGATPGPTPAGPTPTDPPTTGSTPAPTPTPTTRTTPGEGESTPTAKPSPSPTTRGTDTEGPGPGLPTVPLPTPGNPVDGLTEGLLGGTPTPGASPSGGLVGGVGEVLGGLTGTVLGTPAGEAVEQATGGVRELLSGLLRGPRDRPGPTP